MSHLIELKDDEIEMVSGGTNASLSFPNINLPAITLVLGGELNIAPQTAVAFAVLSANTSVNASNWLASLQGFSAQIG